MIMRQDESTDVSGRDLIRGYKASGARTPLKGCIPNTTGDPVFDGTLRQGMAVQLEQSPFLRLVSEQQIRKTLPMMAVTLARASLAHTPGPSTNTEGTQFTSWKIYGQALIPRRNDLRSCPMVLYSSNHYNFMTIWLFGVFCGCSFHPLRVFTTHCN